MGIGGFEQENVDTYMDVFYFSLVNYSSLGLGDIYPTCRVAL
ncbi:ion channel [Roseovarius sp. MBR-51]